ncbi:hypothetical protein HSRCO_0693 [Halanaeroarchaeum sp. HSR-CO]|uniref:hypothetical protein n=1 Tax=Halanaeroarchaeum sp. HSR-CO TaxID=2866382 RepID=UPI00217E7216|nr:hypothetical protein [Halanaeroarchaeum sp. HSR-CO]UWG46988.1 hypothetical protein HSRCO_0693 [Halanaeroarchaeum sp. HSR-CO]
MIHDETDTAVTVADLRDSHGVAPGDETRTLGRVGRRDRGRDPTPLQPYSASLRW